MQQIKDRRPDPLVDLGLPRAPLAGMPFGLLTRFRQFADLPLSNQHATSSDSDQSYAGFGTHPVRVGIETIRYALRTSERFNHFG